MLKHPALQIRWKGCGSVDDTWETRVSVDAFPGSKAALKSFHEQDQRGEEKRKGAAASAAVVTQQPQTEEESLEGDHAAAAATTNPTSRLQLCLRAVEKITKKKTGGQFGSGRVHYLVRVRRPRQSFVHRSMRFRCVDRRLWS